MAHREHQSRKSSWKRRVLYVVIVLTAFAAVCVVALLRMAYGTVAATEGAYTVSGLRDSLSIHFDPYERPYVHAATMEDALFAQGWLHASHRLWQMELLRSAGAGRLAAFMGKSMLATDQELWRMGVPQLAATLEANASPWMDQQIAAYVSGINGALEAGIARPLEFILLGHEPAPWNKSHVYALGALMAYQTSNNADNELLRFAILKETSEEMLAIFLPDEEQGGPFPYVIPTEWESEHVAAMLDRRLLRDPLEKAFMPSLGFGSNGWVLGPEKSHTGNALFAFDSHDGLALPNLFYEVHLFFGAGETIRGWSVPGLPGVINGYNEHIAWGFTTIGDSQDLFVEDRSPDDDMLFRYGDSWYRAESETIAIPVKGQPEPEPFTIVRTRNGPLIHDDPPIALRWAVQDMKQEGMESILRLNRATNWTEFNAALDLFPAPALNATYADRDGNIGFRTAGLLPIRGQGAGLAPLDGADPDAQWRGIIAPAELPAVLNPAAGYIAAANARIQAPGKGPLISADNAPGYRARRLQAVLSARNDFQAQDMAELQMDWYDTQAHLLLDDLLHALSEDTLSGHEASGRQLLATWREHPVAQPDSGAALLFQAWYRALAFEVFEAPLSEAVFGHLIRSTYPLNHGLDRLIRFDHDSPWWRGARKEIIRAAFRRALAEIVAEQGEDPKDWTLGAMHRVVLKHELGGAVPLLGRLFNARPEPWGGSPATVGRGRYRLDRAYDVNSAATIRVVIEMAPGGMEARAIMPGGQSGHPLSPHYLDQFPHWLAGALLPIAPDFLEGPGITLRPSQPQP